ncbi:MAG TPA: hypothetical protein VHW06_15120 [Streptosporangiaceae bacterium]|jgi:hypothetical protein|nr:hypothetical protein [Streptosporangiaceae bacterium]
MMGRNRRRLAGRQGRKVKAGLGIGAAVVIGGGAIGTVAMASGHSAATGASSAGYSRSYSYGNNQGAILNAALADYSWSHARAFALFSQVANTSRETEMWHGHSKLAFERGRVVLATKQFVLIRAANGTFNVWWLSHGTKVTNVAASRTGTTALTGSLPAATAAMAGQMAPATAMVSGSTTAAQKVLAPTATTVSVNIYGTGVTVTVTVTSNMATVHQGKTWWRQPATTAAAGLQRGDLVFVAGTRADKTLHAKVILIEKTATTTTTPTATPSSTVAPTTTPTTTITPTVAPTAAVTPSSTPSAMGSHS